MMEILITGAAGSGTTFMARLMHNTGRDLGSDAELENKRNTLTQVRGLEHKPLMALLQSWTINFFPVVKQGSSRLNRSLSGLLALDDPEIARKVAPDVQKVSMGLPQVVKNPNFMRWLGLWLMAGGKRPNHVFVMMRDTMDATLSNLRDQFTDQQDPLADRLDIWADYGILLETLMRYHIGFDVINFPECVMNPEIIGAVLGIKQEQKLEYLRIHAETANAQGIQTHPHLQEKYRDMARGDIMNRPTLVGESTVAERDDEEITYTVTPIRLV